MDDTSNNDAHGTWPGASPTPAPSWNATPPPAPGYAPPPSQAPANVPPGSGYQPPVVPTYRSWQPGIMPLRPLSFGDFLSVPFKAMRFARPTVLGAPLLFTLISMVLAAAALWVLFNDANLGLLDPYATPGALSGGSIALGIIALVAMLASDILSSAFIAPGVARAVLGEKISISQAWPLVKRRLGSLIGLFFLVGTVMVVTFALALTPFMLLLTGDSGLGTVGVVLGVILLLCLFPVAFALTLAQGVARAIIVLENISLGAALKRMPGLMRGRIWWSILIVFVASILIGIATSIVQYAGQFGVLILTLLAPESEMVLLISYMVMFCVIYTLTTVITYAYLGSTYTLIYIDARMRHEGFDVDLARAAEANATQRL